MPVETELLERYANRGEPRSADSILTQARQAPLPLYTETDDPTSTPPPRRRTLAVAAAVIVLLAAASALAARRTVTDTTPGTPTTSTSPTTLARPSPEELALADRRRDELAARGWVAVGYDAAIPGEPIPEIAYRKAPIIPGGFNSMPFYVTDAKGVQRVEVYDQPDGQIIGYHYGGLGIVLKSTADDPTFDVRTVYRSRGRCEPDDQACVRDMNTRNAPPTDPQPTARR